ncbi:MAG: alpha-glycosidase [Chloroflexi bacterium HGW-Chloroflexi-10]|nr:MAG: alpha-glycosidase [Chloroflexi bacterium HGW-Chloroflexi-10]
MKKIINSPAWVRDAVFYQIFPERFANGDPSNDPDWVLPWGTQPTPLSFMGGDLQGILDHLPYLKEMGFNAIYLTPIFAALSNHKYDASDYLKIDPQFGDLALFKKLVSDAHQQGIRVVLDAVFNHCGDGFWAFQDVMQHKEKSVYRDWFHLTAAEIEQTPPNYQTCGGAGFLPKLNLQNADVRNYLFTVAEYWLKETGMDGWRLDVPWKAPLEFWREFRQVVKKVNPQAYIVAESWRDGLYWLEGDTCDAVMNYPLRDYILDYCARDAMDAEDYDHFVKRLLEQYADQAAVQLNLLGSHDTERILTSCNQDVERAMLAFICMFTAVGVPMVYYGDENGMSGKNDPDCRKCMQWDTAQWNHRIRALLKTLIALRNEHPALRDGAYTTLLTFNGVYAYLRADSNDKVLVVINPRVLRSNVKIQIEGALQNVPVKWRDVLSGEVFSIQDGNLCIPTLAEKQGLILIAETD